MPDWLQVLLVILLCVWAIVFFAVGLGAYIRNKHDRRK